MLFLLFLLLLLLRPKPEAEGLKPAVPFDSPGI
jgi:hypothetical protein